MYRVWERESSYIASLTNADIMKKKQVVNWNEMDSASNSFQNVFSSWKSSDAFMWFSVPVKRNCVDRIAKCEKG